MMGVVTSAQAIEQSQQLGLDITAKYYLVALIHVELCQDSQPFDYQQYQLVERIVSEFAGNNLDVFLTKKDYEELVLFIKGDSQEQLLEETKFLTGLIKKEIEKQTDCNIEIQLGSLQDRLGNVHHSFLEALLSNRSIRAKQTQIDTTLDRNKLPHLNHDAIENFLKFGSIEDFDAFFNDAIRPIGEFALQSYLMKQYLFVDLILTADKFKNEIVGEGEELSSEIIRVEIILDEISSLDQIKSETKRIFFNALDFRNSRINNDRMLLLQKAKAYIDDHCTDPELKMTEVAEKFNLSSNYFSTLFRQENGESFRDYLAGLRINRAKELLRTTNDNIADVAYKSGYKDTHYFSHTFKKKTGQTPSQFREES
jgi:two-component system response regulator YesN